MSTGYQCDRCGDFVDDMTATGIGSEEVYDLEHVSVWVRVTQKGTSKTTGDMCHDCWYSTLVDFDRLLHEEYLHPLTNHEGRE